MSALEQVPAGVARRLTAQAVELRNRAMHAADEWADAVAARMMTKNRRDGTWCWDMDQQKRLLEARDARIGAPPTAEDLAAQWLAGLDRLALVEVA